MNENDFIRQQQAAVERMREFNSRSMYNGSSQPMPPVPPFVKVPGGTRQTNNINNHQEQHENNNPAENRDNSKTKNTFNEEFQNNQPEPEKNEKSQKGNSFFDGINIPFLDMFKKDGDMTLIVGLLLILLSEKADKKLLFALIYILL